MKLLTLVRKSIATNMLMTTSLLLSLYVSHANAQGVTAGTVISNTAVISYQLGNLSSAPETIEVTNTFVVDEIINAVLTSLDATNVTVPTPATNETLTWVLTNTGNGTESFTLATIDTLGNDDFNPSVQSIWIESNSIPGLQGTDTLYQAGSPIQLVNDQSQTLYVNSNIPDNLIKSQLGNVELTVTSTTPGITNSSIGSAIDGGGDANTNAVVLIENGQINSTGSYFISTLELQLNKTVTRVVDPYSGNVVMSQSLITYQIDINAVGDTNSIIENLIIEDVTPVNMQFVSGSIKLNGNALTDNDDDDNADFNITKNDTVTFNLGDLTPPSNQIITITYKVN